MLTDFDGWIFRVLNSGIQRIWSILQPPWPVARLFVLFATALALPLILLGVAEGYRVADEEQIDLRKQYMAISESLGDDVDEALQSHITILETLAMAFIVSGTNLSAAYSQTATILKPLGLFAFLTSPDGQQLFNTRVPFGSPLPRSYDIIEPVLSSRRPRVSDFIVDQVSKRPTIVVSVPVMKDDVLVYVFSLSVDISLFQNILDRQVHKFPRELTIDIIDRKGILIARSPRNDEVVGKTIPIGAVANYIDTTGQARDLEGYSALFARKISRIAGWSILSFAPSSVADAKIINGLLGYVAMIGLVTIFGFIGAIYLGRLIVTPLHQLQRAAAALGKGEAFSFSRCFLKEARAVEEALVQSAAQRKEAEGLSLQSTERFMAAEEGAGGFVYDWDVATNRIWRSPGFTRLVGWEQEEVAPTLEGWRQLVHPKDQAHFQKNREQCIDPAGHYGVEIEVRHRDGHYVWVWDRGRVFRNERGEIIRQVGSKIDITPRKTLEHELSHRYKNLLAVIKSVAKQTLAKSSSMAEAEEALSQRLETLARTYSTLTQAASFHAPIFNIVNDELSAFPSQTQIQGPHFFLKPKAAQTLALIVHELATNAAKYGALSTPKGIVAVKWGTETSDKTKRFHFSWRESGGPTVKHPERRGFGTTLTEDIASIQFGGKICREFQKTGFSYDLIAPISEVSAEV